MARNAIVIKGSDFSANKLTTVTIIQDEKPCTSILLDESSKSVASLGSFSLTATVTPTDTTDEIIWSSSDSSVATVANGVVSVVGVGTAVITATCGTKTATCSVNASEITISPDYAFRQFSTLTSYPNYFGYADSSGQMLICNKNENGNLRTLKNQTADTSTLFAPIALPQNTSAISLSYGTDMRAGTIYFGWLNLNQAAYEGRAEALCVSKDTTNLTAYNQAKTYIYEVPEGVNSFAIILKVASSLPSDTPGSVALAKEIVVKALSEVPNNE